MENTTMASSSGRGYLIRWEGEKLRVLDPELAKPQHVDGASYLINGYGERFCRNHSVPIRVAEGRAKCEKCLKLAQGSRQRCQARKRGLCVTCHNEPAEVLRGSERRLSCEEKHPSARRGQPSSCNWPSGAENPLPLLRPLPPAVIRSCLHRSNCDVPPLR